MTALGNVPCNGCRACCLHDMIPLMPERGCQSAFKFGSDSLLMQFEGCLAF